MASRRKTEQEILFPEVQCNGFTVTPYTFGQAGKAARLLVPFIGALTIEESGELSGLNVPALAYMMTEGDCGTVFELMAMATGASNEQLQALSFDQGVELLKVVFDAAIMPMVSSLGKLIPKKDTSSTSECSESSGA